MKRLVNGVEVELETGNCQVSQGSDRLHVRSPEHAHTAVAVRKGDSVTISYKGDIYQVEKPSVVGAKGVAHATGQMRAPMPGLIVDVLVKVGDAVTKGQKLLVLEAMKTQQPFVAPFDGVVSEVGASAGEQVAEGAVLIVVEETSAQ
ncbi:MAG TPA: biotin/lipoyl-binding protein [Fimbriimonadaceae bacterium]|nr:biotin/lipoyl-binding protein [Fimbriimonadaceae bacterium]